jgi:predicted lipid-binding transport protein (Tim44 family)
MGNGFQFIDIIFFAMIAAFLVLRLRNVLGRRDGHENKPSDPFSVPDPKETADENVIQLPERPETVSADADPEDILAGGLAQIGINDPSFNPAGFLDGARVAFEMVLNAYVSGDTAILKSLLSPEVFAGFEKAIRDREQAGEVLEDTLVGIRVADLVEAYMDGTNANVTVKFISEQVNVTRDDNGDVVDGNPNLVIDVTDFWTFSRDTRSSDPNWLLVATSSPD